MQVTLYALSLADTKHDPSIKLEFKQRLSVALGAAKGRVSTYSNCPRLNRIEKESF